MTLVCKVCSKCGSWFGRKQMFRHSCNQQKITNPECDEMTLTEPHGLGGDEISAATTQATPKSLGDLETESLDISNGDCHKLQADAICSRTSSPLSEFEKSPVLAMTPVQNLLKRPRPCTGQNSENPHSQRDSFGPEEIENMRPIKLRK